MHETAFAKINLALHVRAREPDGYHGIETVFAFAEDGDLLAVEPAEGLSLRIGGPFAPQLEGSGQNLVLRAAEALRARFETKAGAAIVLEKRLPVAAGLGGGSADAAAALRLLARWWELECAPEVLEEIGRGLGADVAACIRSRLVRGEGRGDRLVPLDAGALAGAPLLIVNPGVALATRDVFARWDGVDRGGLPEGALEGRNDLEAPAIAFAPAVEEVLGALRECPGAGPVRMSGSGASCFALFADEAGRDRAAASIEAAHPRWWLLPTRIRRDNTDG